MQDGTKVCNISHPASTVCMSPLARHWILNYAIYFLRTLKAPFLIIILRVLACGWCILMHHHNDM